MFTSNEVGQFERDPEPYIGWSRRRHPEEWIDEIFLSDGPVAYEPRPEFRTPVNRILQDYRIWQGSYTAQEYATAIEEYEDDPHYRPTLPTLDQMLRDLEYTPMDRADWYTAARAERIHARRVLTLLYKLREDK